MFFTYLRRELRRRARAMFAIALGLALGIGPLVTVSCVATGTRQAKGRVVQSLYGRGTDLTVTSPAPTAHQADFAAPHDGDRVTLQGGQPLDASVVPRVRGQHGVADAAGGLGLRVVKGDGHRTGGLPAGAAATGEVNGQHGYGGYGGVTDDRSGTADDYRAYGVDVSKPGIGPLTATTITSGTGFSATQADDRVAVVDRDYARRASLSVGRSLTVHGSTFKVIGIAAAAHPAAEVYLPLHQAQALANDPGKVTTVYVRATDPRHLDTVKSAIQHGVPGTRVTTSAELAAGLAGPLSTAANLASRLGRWVSLAVLGVAFLAAGLLTWSAVGRRTREFGTLRTLGWSSGRVVRQVVGESLVHGLIGGALGIALGLAAAYAVTAAGPTLTARAGGVTMPHIALTAPANATTILVASALAVGGGLVAAGVGGWRVSRLRPADALRPVARVSRSAACTH
jgi:ABC-type lipoprotein release transport system permease subunit